MDGLKKGQEDKFVHHRAHAKEVLLEKLGQNAECRKLTAVLYNKTIYRHNAFHRSHDLLGSCLFEKTSPLYWAIKLCFKLRRKVWVREIWRVVLLHKVNNARQSPLLPVIPKPLRGKAWNRENSPVYEDSEFCIVVPIRQGSGIKRFPIRVISNCQRHICQQMNHENDPKNLAKF